MRYELRRRLVTVARCLAELGETENVRRGGRSAPLDRRAVVHAPGDGARADRLSGIVAFREEPRMVECDPKHYGDGPPCKSCGRRVECIEVAERFPFSRLARRQEG